MSRARLPVGEPPGADVLDAFGATHQPRLLAGGMGRTYRSGDLVLKPVDGPPGQHEWMCEVFDTWPAGDRVRVPRPVRTLDGAWSAHGWAAHRWVPGRTARCGEDPAAFRRTCDAFHDAVSGLARPDFLDARDDPWSHGDRVAFGEAEPVGPPEVLALLEPLLAATRPLALEPQVIHGDLGGNVLRAPGRPDAVIDWPPYFRPRDLALAIIATDAVAWEGAPERLLDAWADVPGWSQLMVRAVVCRVATRGRHEHLGWPTTDSVEKYADRRRPSVEMVLRRV